MHSTVEAHNEVAEIFQAEIYSTDCLHCPAQAGLLVHKTQSGNTDTPTDLQQGLTDKSSQGIPRLS